MTLNKWTAQHADEIAAFVQVLRGWRCRSYLEIGARFGGSFAYVGRRLPARSRLVAVDLPGGPWGRRGSDVTLRKFAAQLHGRGYDTHVILGNSQHEAIVADVGQLGPFDAVFIDGDHSYESVMSDWHNYGPMGRVIAFHDVHPNAGQPGVARAWNEISAHRLALTICGAKANRGIGIVFAQHQGASHVQLPDL